MPFITNQAAQIYWDEQGEGEPILLITGLGFPSVMWHRTRPLLAASYRTIALDNRGVGLSDVPPGPYSIALMAADAVAVLDASGCDSAHVYGVSMGGMIAQELTLRYPQRVRSLVLGCTAPGGPHAVRAEPEVIEFLMSRSYQNQEDAAEASVPFIYDQSTPRERIDEDMTIRKRWLPKPEAYLAQLQGILTWAAYDRLDQIKVPTLVIHGETDRLVPIANGELIARRIPGARFVRLPHASHIYTTDQNEPAQAAVMEFLNAQMQPEYATTE
jgi:pimeloyl-ACP methyl ester carboxylesterase